MKIGRSQGVAILILGLVLLTGGILVLISVPSWGGWISGYPEQIAAAPFPPEAASIAQGIVGVLGPLLEQVGGYVRIAGYFVGSLLTIISLGVTAAGIMLTRTATSQA